MGSTWTPNWIGVVIGLVVAGVAGIISVASYEAASNGGSYVVFYGAVIAGLLISLRSLLRFHHERPPWDPVFDGIDALDPDMVTYGEASEAWQMERSARTAGLLGAAAGRHPGTKQLLEKELRQARSPELDAVARAAYEHSRNAYLTQVRR